MLFDLGPFFHPVGSLLDIGPRPHFGSQEDRVSAAFPLRRVPFLAVAPYIRAAPLGVRVVIGRIAKPHTVAAIVRRCDAPAARRRGDTSITRGCGAELPSDQAARRNCQRHSRAAYDSKQFFQGFPTM
jgi:hypothetical protein